MRVRDIPAVLVSAARILRTYWAAFIVIACLGLAVRSGAVWLAVIVSDYNGFAAQLVLVLAPLGYLLAMIAMLYMTRGALPSIKALSESEGRQAVTEKRELRLVDVAVSVLVPFLAVYVSYGLLKEDISRFTNQAAYEEYFQFSLSKPVEVDFSSRLAVWDARTILMIIAIAWVLRFALGKLEGVTKFLALAFVGALVEVYYTSQVAQWITDAREGAVAWIEGRQASHVVLDRYDQAVAALGPLANPVDTVTAWLFGLVGAIDAIVIVPLAWLTVGAVILGHKLAPPEQTGPVGQLARPRAAMARVTDRLPAPVRRLGGGLGADVRERWSAFWNGLRLMGAAGLMPMLTFSLVFLVVLRAPWLVGQVIRLIMGPVPTRQWLAFSPLEEAAGRAVAMVLTAALLAAAIDWLLGPRVTGATQPSAAPESEPVVSVASEA